MDCLVSVFIPQRDMFSFSALRCAVPYAATGRK